MADAEASHIDHVKRQDVPTQKPGTRRIVCAHTSGANAGLRSHLRHAVSDGPGPSVCDAYPLVSGC